MGIGWYFSNQIIRCLGEQRHTKLQHLWVFLKMGWYCTPFNPLVNHHYHPYETLPRTMGYTKQSESQLETQSHKYPMNIPQLSCTYSIFRSSHTTLSYIWIIILQLYIKISYLDGNFPVIWGWVKTLAPSEHQNTIAGKWMFIPVKMVLIGIDPYPYPNPRQLRHGNDRRRTRATSFSSSWYKRRPLSGSSPWNSGNGENQGT